VNFGHYNATLELSFFLARILHYQDIVILQNPLRFSPHKHKKLWVNCLLFYLTCLIWKVYSNLHFPFRNEWSKNLDELV